MAGGGSQSSKGQNGLGTLNPVTAGISNLFGGGINNLPQGGFASTLPNQILPNVFTPQSFADLGTLTTPLNPVQFDLGQIGQFGGQALSTLGEAAQTGLIDPAKNLFNQLFQEKAAGIAENAGLSGINTNDTDFQAMLLREAQLGSSQLADLAQSRRLQAAQLFPSAAQDLLSTEGAARSAERARSSGGQQLDLLNTLAQLGSSFAGVGTNKASGKNWNVL